MKRLLILAPLLLAPLAGCGTTLGDTLGLTTAGSAQVSIKHVAGNPCPDADAAGSLPLSGFTATCKDGQHEETIHVDSSDPTALVTENNKILAGALAGLLARGAAAAATGGASLPVGSAVSPMLGQTP